MNTSKPVSMHVHVPFNFKFVKEAWKTVGDHVCKAIKEFFDIGKLLGELNATVMLLIPKSKTPCKVNS